MTTTITPDQLIRFTGRKNIYAMQTKYGSYVPIHRKITTEILQEHLNGKRTLGSYVIKEDGTVDFAVIDIDGDESKLKAYESLGRLIFDSFPEFERVFEFSGRRGYHIWLFTKKPEPPKFMRELIKSRFKALGIRNIEIYPKQDTVDVLKKKLGNLVKLPEGIHRKSGKRSRILEWKKAEK